MEKQTLGKTISSLRKDLGMTQAQLAEKMNITDKAVSKWERDLSCPDIDSLPKLAELLGVSVNSLMQVKKGDGGETVTDRIQKTVALILRAVALACGVAVVVLSVMEAIDVRSATSLLGIGLACIAVHSFDRSRDR